MQSNTTGSFIMWHRFCGQKKFLHVLSCCPPGTSSNGSCASTKLEWRSCATFVSNLHMHVASTLTCYYGFSNSYDSKYLQIVCSCILKPCTMLHSILTWMRYSCEPFHTASDNIWQWMMRQKEARIFFGATNLYTDSSQVPCHYGVHQCV